MEGDRTFIAHEPVDVISLHYTGFFDLERAFMVEKLTKLHFDDGALTGIVMRKPSEVLATVKPPLAVVDTILAVPGNFVGQITGGAQALAALKSDIANRDDIYSKLDEINSKIASRFDSSVADFSDTWKAQFDYKCTGGSAEAAASNRENLIGR